MNRRKFLAAIAAGGVVTATGLWMPGQKLISIPSGKVFYGPDIITAVESWRKCATGWRHMIVSEHDILVDEIHQVTAPPFTIGTRSPHTNNVIYVTREFSVTSQEARLLCCGGSVNTPW